MRKKKAVSAIVLILAFMMSFASAMPSFLVHAEETGNVTREEWIRKLVQTFELSVEEGYEPDNYYPDLSEEDEYYSDMITGINFGLLDVKEGENVEPTANASREFAVHTLNYLLGFNPESEAYSFTDSDACKYPEDDQVAIERNWLTLNGDLFNPSDPITSAEADQMIADAAEVLAADVIDPDYENTYEIDQTAGAVDIPEGTSYLWIDSSTVQLTDCQVVLSEGDDFILHMDDIIGTYNAQAITRTGNVMTVTVAEASNEEIVTDIDAEGILDLSNVYVEPAENTEIYYEDIDSGETYQDLQAAVQAVQSKGVHDLSSLEIKGTTKLSIGSSTTVKLGWAFKDPKIEYKFSTKEMYAKIVLKGKLEQSFNIESNADDVLEGANIELLQLGVRGIGGIKVSTKVEAKASLSGTNSTNVSIGVKYDNGKINTIKKFSAAKQSLTAEATAAVGLNVSLGINDIPGNLLTGEIFVEGGVKASIKSQLYNDGKLPQNCTHFAAYVYAEAGYNAKFNFIVIKKSYGDVFEIYNEKNSPAKIVKHYEDRKQVPSCTRGTHWSDKYFTNGSSIFSDSGWSGGDNSWLLNGAGEPYCIFGYELDEDNNATITSYEGNMKNLEIPETIDDYPVVAIGSDVFAGNSLLSSVTFPASVKEINSGAFRGCSNISWLNFADGLVTIYGQAFADCTSLSYVELPDSLITLDQGAFARCTNLVKVILSKNLETMNAHAFFNDDKLTSIEIPKSLKAGNDSYIYDYAYDYQWGPFYECDGLKTVTFEEGTTEITQGLFANCPGIEEITIPGTITTIEANAFQNCKNLSKITFSEGLTSIGGQAFADNPKITSLELADSIQTIYGGAFGNCANLASVKLPKQLVKMDAHAFYNADLLTDIEIPKSLTDGDTAYIYAYAYDYQWGPFYGCDGLKNVTFEEGTTEITQGLFANCPGLESITIPDTVTKVEGNAFNNARHLKDITFGNGLTYIGGTAFASCVSIEELNLSDSILTIDAGAFAQCSALTKAKLPKMLTTMNAHAFYNDDLLAEIEIPKALKNGNTAYIYEYAYDYQWGPFYGCDGLKKVTFEEGTTEITQGLFAHCGGIEEIVIPDSIVTLENDCFLQATGLRKVTLPAKLETLGTSSFNGCTSLESIEIPDSVTDMGSYVCNGCTNLKSAKLPATLTYLEDHTFSECKALESITIPEPVTVIRVEAFMNCTALAEIKWNQNLKEIYNYAFENNDALTSLSLPESVTTVTRGAFYDCDGLTSVVLPDSLTTLGERVFYKCELLKDVRLSEGMTAIQTETFFECPSLEAVRIPHHVTEINGTAFANCTSLVSMTIPRNVTSIDTEAFSYPAKMVIYGVSGTYAETFANENGYKFVAIDVPVTKATLSSEELTLVKGQRETLTLTIEPEDYTDEIVWKSSDAAVATVDNGVVRGIELGSTTIKVNAGNVSATCKVNVVQPVTRITLNSSSVSLEGAETYQFVATVTPENAYNKDIIWSSDDPSVVSIDENGLATALKKGSTYINAEAADGSGKLTYASVTVTSNANICTSVDELESEHNYQNNTSEIWAYTLEGASRIAVTFDERTIVEDGFDFIYIYDKEGNEIGKYTGTELAGQTILINGDTVKIKLVSDDGGTEWGFKVTSVTEDNSCEHTHTSIQNAKDPTCTEEGYTGDEVCDECGAIVKRGEVIPALGHQFGNVSYVWTADFSSVTATAVCTRCGETITETVETEYSVISEPVCGKDGTGRYTAVFTDPSFETQYKDVAIPATGEHTVGEAEYTWAADNSTVTASVTCTECGEVITETVNTVYEVIQAATLEAEGLGRYTADFENDLFETQTKDVVIPKLSDNTPQSIILNTDSITVVFNQNMQLSAAIEPANADQSVTWSSSNESVATVDANGLIRGTGIGTAMITATTSNGLSASCYVRVLFTDVADSKAYYFNPVYWAVDFNITVGAGGPGKFSPNASCTREQFVTFLWRFYGEPEPTTTSNFSDVKTTDWYYKPITWAAEKGITVGLNDGTGRFGVGQACTREQCVTFLHRSADSPEPAGTMEFTDSQAGRYYYKAIKWAAEHGITVGLNDGTGRFGVGQKCTRGMLVTFLSRFSES